MPFAKLNVIFSKKRDSTPTCEMSDTATHTHSVWLQGANAARSGVPVTDCPFHPLNYDFVVWHNGWAAATHNIAQEENDL